MAGERLKLLEAGRYLNEDRAAEAIRLLEGLTASTDHEPVRLRYLAIGYNIAGETDRAVDLIERSIGLAASLGQDEEPVWARSLLAGIRIKQGRSAEAVALLRGCLEECERGIVVDVGFRVGCLTQLATELAVRGERAEALEICTRAVDLASRFDDKHARADLYAELGSLSLDRGDQRNGEYYRQKSAFVLEELRLMGSLARLMDQAGTLYSDAGDDERAHECRARAETFREATLR